MDYGAIAAEIAKPVYNGQTATQIAATLQAMTVAGASVPCILPTYRIYNAIVPSEFSALAAANQQLVRDILGMGTVDASPGTNVRAVIQAIFTGKVTLTNLAALVAPFDSPSIPFARDPGETITADVITRATQGFAG